MELNGDTTLLLAQGIEVLYFVLLLFFTIHAVILGYHWFTYGSSKHISMTALCIYLSGGALLLLTLSAAITTL
jgi:hypothetical protein